MIHRRYCKCCYREKWPQAAIFLHHGIKQHSGEEILKDLGVEGLNRALYTFTLQRIQKRGEPFLKRLSGAACFREVHEVQVQNSTT